MSSKGNVWLKIAGASGILAPIIAFTCIFLAIAFYPQFSWTENALSDLGVEKGISTILFNSGLIIGGVLALIFAFGLFTLLRDSILGKVGALLFILATMALTAIGVFPENIKPTHYLVSVAFFALSPIALLVITVAFMRMAKPKMGAFTFIIALTAAAVWIIHWTVGFGSNVAIPEALSAIAASTWAIVLGCKMLK